MICKPDKECLDDNHVEMWEDCQEDERLETDLQVIENSPQISLNALSGVNSYQTMRVKGVVGKRTLHILGLMEYSQLFG